VLSEGTQAVADRHRSHTSLQLFIITHKHTRKRNGRQERTQEGEDVGKQQATGWNFTETVTEKEEN